MGGDAIERLALCNFCSLHTLNILRKRKIFIFFALTDDSIHTKLLSICPLPCPRGAAPPSIPAELARSVSSSSQFRSQWQLFLCKPESFSLLLSLGQSVSLRPLFLLPPVYGILSMALRIVSPRFLRCVCTFLLPFPLFSRPLFPVLPWQSPLKSPPNSNKGSIHA